MTVHPIGHLYLFLCCYGPQYETVWWLWPTLVMFYGHGEPSYYLFGTIVSCSVRLGILWYWGHVTLMCVTYDVTLHPMRHLNLILWCFRPQYETVSWLWQTLVMFYGHGDPGKHFFSTVVSCSVLLSIPWYWGHMTLMSGTCDVTVNPIGQLYLTLFCYRPQYETVWWLWHTLVMFYGHGDPGNHLFSKIVNWSILLGKLWY